MAEQTNDEWADFREQSAAKPNGEDRWSAFREQPAFKPNEQGQGALAEGIGILKDAGRNIAPLKNAAGKLMQKGASQVSDFKQRVMGMDADIDYESGAPYLVQKDLQRASNADEARAMLEKRYGKDSVGQDDGGRWWYKEGDKRKSVFAGGAAGNIERGVAGLQATVPEFGGAVIGGVAGALAGGPPGAFAGSVGGALLGKSLDEGLKYLEGFFRKSPEQVAETVNSVGVWNSLFSGAGPVAKQVFGPVGNALRQYLGVTPETRAMTQRALELGATPPITSVAPEFKSMADKQKLRNIVMGDPQTASRVSAVSGKVRDSLQSEGYPAAKVDRIMTEVMDPTTALTESEVGRVIVPPVVEHFEQLEARANAYLGEAERVSGQSRKLFKAVADRPIGTFGSDVAQAMQESRAQVSQSFGPAYAHVDEMLGGKAIVPTWLLKREAAELTKNIPPDRMPAIFREIEQMGETITAANAHRLRSQLRTMANSGNLTPDINNHEFGRLADAVDAGFSQVAHPKSPPEAQWMLNGTELYRSRKQQRQAIDFMRKVDKMYGDQIAFYNDQQVNQLARLVDAGHVPDPEYIAGLIGRVGFSDRLKQTLAKLPPELRRDVATADMRMMFQDTEKATKALGFENDGKAFYATVNERRPLLDAIYAPIYGRDFVGRLEKAAQEMAALDGKMNLPELEQKVRGLGPGAMLDALNERIIALKEIQEFAQKSPLRAFLSGRPDAVDQAYRTVMQPGKDEALKSTYSFFGEGVEMDAIRDFARKDLIKSAIFETPSRVQMIDGKAIENALSKYTPYQKEVLFPNGAAQDLTEIAKLARFLFPETMGSDFATSQAAKSITLHTGPFILNPRTAYADARWILVNIVGFIADRPAVARMLAGLNREEPSVARKVFQGLSRWAITEQLHAGPSDESLQ